MRVCLCFLAAGLAVAAQALAGQALHGKLIIVAGQAPALETADRKTVRLAGDEDTTKILNDSRLNGFEVEARGHFTAPDQFLIDPIHTRALLVRRDGKLKLITYFCDVCNIRAYIPGPCACCQRETTLELRDPDEK
jgi:hypothetical protein